MTSQRVESEILNLSSRLDENRSIFLLNYRDEFFAFADSDRRLQEMAFLVAKRRDDQNRSLVSLWSFF